MTHTNTTRELENAGSLMLEVLEIDISALDRAGEEDNVAPTHLDNVEAAVAHHSGGSNQNGEYQFGWNETSNVLSAHNVSSDAAAPNNAALNTTKVAWFGTR